MGASITAPCPARSSASQKKLLELFVRLRMRRVMVAADGAWRCLVVDDGAWRCVVVTDGLKRLIEVADRA